MKNKNSLPALTLFFSIIIALAMTFFPQATFSGANTGLKTWSTILVPSLLPFFIITDVLIQLGLLRILGIILEPLMRPVFGQPGEAGFVLAMGFTTGFPMGAILTNSLYEKDLCSKEEAARLIAYTNNSSPLFLLVAIPVGMLHSPEIGLLLIISHYLANILLGIFLGFKKGRSSFPLLNQESKKTSPSVLAKDKSIGVIMTNAIKKATHNLLVIGGFVVFFAVLIEILKVTNLNQLFSLPFKSFLQLIKLEPVIGDGLTIGLFEMTLGADTIAQAPISLMEKSIAISLILGWSGFSVHAQVISIISQNQIPIKYYLSGRIFQSIFAAIIAGLLYKPLTKLAALPVFIQYFPTDLSFNWWTFLTVNLKIALAALSFLILISFLFSIKKLILIR